MLKAVERDVGVLEWKGFDVCAYCVITSYSIHYTKLYDPAGIDIGARTPKEIAVSVIAAIAAQRESIAITTKRPSQTAKAKPVPTKIAAASTTSEAAPSKGSCCHSDSD